MALSYEDLIAVDLGKLGTAVDDWKTAVKHLKDLAHSADAGMKAKAEAARWSGMNATVTREFVRKTAHEFSDLHTEGNSIYQILDDAHRELLTLQRTVKSLVEDAKAEGYTVTDNGDTTVTVKELLQSGEPSKEGAKEKIQHYADQISARVGRANDIDQSAQFALAGAHGKDAHNPGATDFDSLNEAQAARAVELAAKGAKMTDAELREFNRLMKYNGSETGGEFATDFYKGLGGPEKVLEFYGSMALDGTSGDDKTRLSLTKDMQRSMGVALANATDPDHQHHLPASWGDQMRKLGTQRLKIDGAELGEPYGYQVLGGLLRYGNYDADFINPIAGHIIQLHHKSPNLFTIDQLNTNLDPNRGFNPSGKVGAGYDPLTSALEALGHSPEASKEFFSGENPPVYNTDGTVNSNEKLEYNYFDELTDKKFQWPSDGAEFPAKQHGADALGHALESATLGHAYDDPTPVLARDDDSADLMEKVVHTYGSDAKLVKQQESLSDSLGRMAAGYIDDVNWGLEENSSTSIYAPAAGAQGHALFGLKDTTNFLSTLGQHPDAYADVSSANSAYSASVLEAQVRDDGTIAQGAVRDAVRNGAQLQGLLDQSRADQIEADGMAKDKEYNDALEKRNAWVELGATAAVGAGVALLPEVAAAGVLATAVPIITDTGQDALENQISNVIGDWTETSQHHSNEDVQEQRRAIYAAGRANAQAPAQNFMVTHSIDPRGTFGQDLKDAWINGYGLGTDREDQQGQLPQTGE